MGRKLAAGESATAQETQRRAAHAPYFVVPSAQYRQNMDVIAVLYAAAEHRV